MRHLVIIHVAEEASWALHPAEFIEEGWSAPVFSLGHFVGHSIGEADVIQHVDWHNAIERLNIHVWRDSDQVSGILLQPSYEIAIPDPLLLLAAKLLLGHLAVPR